MLSKPPSTPKYLFAIGIVLAAALFLADQYTKWLIMEKILRLEGEAQSFWNWATLLDKIPLFVAEREPFKILTLTSFLDLRLVWNQGISFGLFNSGMPGSDVILIAVALIISLLMAVWMALGSTLWQTAALGLVIGGALGNVADRIRFGAVVDFIDLHAGAWHWPAFNVADTAIVIGGALLVLELLITKNQPLTAANNRR